MNGIPPTIKEQFELYLQKCGLDKSKISDLHYKAIRTAFYAGSSLTILNMLENITNLSEEEGIKEFDKLLNESKEFYKSE